MRARLQSQSNPPGFLPGAAPTPSNEHALSNAEFGAVQAYTENAINSLLRMGLTVHIEHDFEAFARYRRSVGDGFVNASFDPERCCIGAEDFWLRVVDDTGKTAATSAARIFHGVDDFYQLMESGRLWSDRLLRVVDRCETACSIPPFSGVMGYWGGMWVDPAQRGRGLSRLVPALQRGLMLRNSAIDFETGLVFEPLADLALKQYQFARVEIVVDGYFPLSHGPSRVFLCHTTRAELMRLVGFSTADDVKPMSAVA
jgi:hypothetical protein